MKTLKDAKIGDTVKVVKLHGEGPIKRRIMDMGITKGTEVYIRKVAPLGDPMEVTVRGYELSLRKADTEMIEIVRRQLAGRHGRKEGRQAEKARRHRDHGPSRYLFSVPLHARRGRLP